MHQVVEETNQGSDGAGGLSRYLTGAVLVRLADEGARIALVLLSLQRTGSPGTGGLLVAALLIPHVVAGPVVGALADRVRQPRWVLAGAAAGFALSLAATALLLGRLPLAGIVAVLVLGGCCGPALTGGLTSQLSSLVAEPSLPRAFGADSLSYNVSGIAGPAVAAVVAGASTPAAATLVLAGSAAVGGVLLVTVPTPRREGGPRTNRLPLLAGVTAVVRDRTLAVVTAASSLGQLGPGALAVVATVLATRQQQPAAAGWLMTSVALGGLIGSSLWTWRPATTSHSPMVVMAALAGVGLPLLLAAGSPSLVLTAVLFGASGLGSGPFVGALFTVRQRHAPEGLRAQVFTIGAGLKTSAAAAGAALGAALANLPTATQLLLVGAGPILVGGLGAAALGLITRHGSALTASRQDRESSVG